MSSCAQTCLILRRVNGSKRRATSKSTSRAKPLMAASTDWNSITLYSLPLRFDARTFRKSSRLFFKLIQGSIIALHRSSAIFSRTQNWMFLRISQNAHDLYKPIFNLSPGSTFDTLELYDI